MIKQTLMSALAQARIRSADIAAAAPRAEIVVTDDTLLLNALRNSATPCDQILQRRLGVTK